MSKRNALSRTTLALSAGTTEPTPTPTAIATHDAAATPAVPTANWQLPCDAPTYKGTSNVGSTIGAAYDTIAQGVATLATVQARIDALALRGSHNAMVLLRWCAKHGRFGTMCTNGVLGFYQVAKVDATA